MPKPSHRHRNRSKNTAHNLNSDLSSTAADKSPHTSADVDLERVCLDRHRSLSIAADKEDTGAPDRAAGLRAKTEEEQQLSEAAVEQSLSEMVLVTTNKPNSVQAAPRASSSPAQPVTTSAADSSADRMFQPATTTTTNGHPPTEDPFAKERQKRLLPSNTVSLGAGSFEGRSELPLTVHLPAHQEEMCHTLIRDLNKYGVCVLDEFLGERGQQVLSEVVTMYSAGKFKDGQLVQPSTKAGEIRDLKHIRGDKITWIGGREPGCSNIGYLINQVDSVITMANKMLNNGKLGQYQIRERTKAMVACYPGSGTHYVKHVDNPTRDGRCITAIYYLNPNWDAGTSGGLLRMFPENLPVVDIAPQFDRILFFWSDRRNPHEVQPAHRTRYAITLWYHDAVEREQALQRYQRENLMKQQQQQQRADGNVV